MREGVTALIPLLQQAPIQNRTSQTSTTNTFRNLKIQKPEQNRNGSLKKRSSLVKKSFLFTIFLVALRLL